MNEQIFPVITLYQPWASWIIGGWKTIETRTHDRFACLLGKTILIHAGQTYDEQAIKSQYVGSAAFASSFGCPTGCILGSALVDHIGPLDGRHSQDAMIDCESTLRFGLFLTEVHEFDNPIFVKGSMGIWYFDMNTNRKVSKPR